MRILKLVLLGLLVAVFAAGGYVWGIQKNWFGVHRDAGKIQGQMIPAQVIANRQARQNKSALDVGQQDPKQIMFGDVHVHTTFSTDAFMWSLPIFGGEGSHPMADACDFARYCSAIDFWSINDHAEASTPARWLETKQSIRQCNARAGDPANPDIVAFMGFEWSQVGRLPSEHYGHKNVIFKGLDDKDIAARPIAAAGAATATIRGSATQLDWRIPLADFPNRQNYFDFRKFAAEIRAVPDCDPSMASSELPDTCYEQAVGPGELVTRLNSQNLEYLLVPHGTTWGFYTPPGTTFDKQLSPKMHPEKQTLIEIMSGHGNAEEYRSWKSIENLNEKAATASCPVPSANYLPSCWQAGEIIRARCLAADETPKTCEIRAISTRARYASLGVAGHTVISGQEATEWLDAGQCQDCFLPTFNTRPGVSVQYGLAISNFENGPDDPTRFNWGFVAASDNHRARPGTGYKAYERKVNTEASGPKNENWRNKMLPRSEKLATAVPVTRQDVWDNPGFHLLELERQASFFTTGGLTAVHSNGRSRGALWDAMQRRETYATSGPRILLWFDLLSPDGSVSPMGSSVQMAQNPTFRVRATGAFKQKPGCPDFASNGLPAERLGKLCRGECYNPSDERLKITRIEVVKITPQMLQDEPVQNLIHDTWKSFDCDDQGTGCSIEFTDPEYANGGRDSLYYVRAIQQATPTINGANLRCIFDKTGKCVAVNPCYGDARTPKTDNCLADVENRAWSSPIRLQMAAQISQAIELE
ncbi:FIG00764702: hypothetical protein [hydrothermal vent metagenome]|uniref:DUF3604 domain-containing protein n=1 Tax=hydrothermal vent metagenome TaxID=652676 RepID=A0A3B0R4P9_9ZZZZ